MPVKQSKLQAAEIRVLRLIMGVTKHDRMKNTHIRSTLGVEPLILEIEKSMLRWFGHVKRMPPTREVKNMLEWWPQGRRPRGRPIRRWLDGVAEVLHRNGASPRDTEEMCQDRTRWRRFVRDISTDRPT